MPLGDQGWELIPAGTRRAQVRDDYSAALGVTPSFDGTIDGAWTIVASELQFRSDQSAARAVSSMLLATAPAEVVVARALDAGLTPQPATRSRYGVEVVGAGTLPVGIEAEGGGARWVVIESPGAVTSGDVVLVEAVEPGPIALPNTVTVLELVTPVPGISSLEYDPGGGLEAQLGRIAETLPALRVRTARAESSRLVVERVRDLPWVVAASLEDTPGNIRIGVAPGPVGADQTAELAATIQGGLTGGVLTLGTESAQTPGMDGRLVTVRWDEGQAQAVVVAYALTLDGSVSAGDADDAAEAALREVFARLGPGETVRYLRAIAALDLPGVTGATLTLDGGTADVTPATPVDVLYPVFS